jgi:hypothetical protein
MAQVGRRCDSRSEGLSCAGPCQLTCDVGTEKDAVA